MIKKIITLAQKYRKWLIDLTMIVVTAILTYWLFKGYAGRLEVNTKVDEIKTTIETNTRRVEDIIDATKAKEVAASEEVKTAIDTASADALPDLLKGLLADYRKNKH